VSSGIQMEKLAVAQLIPRHTYTKKAYYHVGSQVFMPVNIRTAIFYAKDTV
jgi:hypothetical protein